MPRPFVGRVGRPKKSSTGQEVFVCVGIEKKVPMGGVILVAGVTKCDRGGNGNGSHR